MKHLLTFLSLILFCFITEIHPLPRFSLRTGALCGDCHVNPTGGNLRTTRGWNFGKNTLAIISPDKEFKMSNKIGENLQFGVDYRGQYLVTLSDSTSKSDFQRMAGSIYTSIGLSEEITAFARYDFIQSVWEGYVVAKILPNDSYIKGGTFSPNYGIRIDDHTAYTRGGDMGFLFATDQRRGLIYDPRYVETGAEVGAYISDFAFLTASVGNPRTQLFQSDPTYTANLMIKPTLESKGLNFFVGGSFARFRGIIPPSFNKFPAVTMYGGYLGFGYKNFTIMAEYDLADSYIYTDTSSGALMTEAAYKIINGLEAVVRYDRFDPNPDNKNDNIDRVIVGCEFFPYAFIEIRPEFRLQMQKDSLGEDITHKSIVVQFHLWY